MASMRDIIIRAHIKVGIVAHDTDLTADEGNGGLEALNSMLHEWSLRGVNISHSDLELSDTFPMAAAYEDGAVYMLATRIAPDYEVPVSFDADDFFRAIQAAYMTIDTVSMPRAVTEVPSKKERDGTLGYQWR